MDNNAEHHGTKELMNEYEQQKDFIAFFQLQELYEQFKVLSKTDDTQTLNYITLLIDVNKKLGEITQMTLKYANSQTTTSTIYVKNDS